MFAKLDPASRSAVDRAWRSAHQQTACQRRCVVLVAAFNEGGRRPAAKTTTGAFTPPPAPSAAATTTATAGSSYLPRAPPHQVPGPLTLDRVESLHPSALAASLLEFVSLDTPHRVPNGAVAAVGDPRLLDAVARRLARSVQDFDGAALVDVLHAYSRAGHGRSNRDALAICCVALSGKMDELTPRELTRLAVACAALQLRPTDMLAALCSRASEPAVLSHFTAPDLAALLEALSQLQHRSPAFFADAADVLATELQLQVPQVLQGRPSGAAGGWGPGPAAARVGPGPGAAGRRGLAALTPAQAVSAVWATAEASLYHRQLFDLAGALLMDRLGELDGRALAKVAWSYATVRHADESHRALWDRDLFDGLAWVCLDRGVSSFPPRALVTLLWSFASLPHYDGPLFDAAAAALAPRLLATTAAVPAAATAAAPPPSGPSAELDLAPGDLVAIAWAVQRVAHAHVGLMEALGQAALASLDRLDGDDLTTIAMAFPAAKAYSEPFFKYLVSEAQTRPQFFGQVALLDIIRLISRVQYRDPDYYGPALQVLLDHVHKAFLDAPVDKAGCMNPFRFG